MRKKELAKEVIERLKKEYPDAGCSLEYDQAWKLLVSVRLAAQCTDARVNIVVEKLYEKFPDVKALAEAPVEEIEEIVRPCGLGKSKARDISTCSPLHTLLPISAEQERCFELRTQGDTSQLWCGHSVSFANKCSQVHTVHARYCFYPHKA